MLKAKRAQHRDRDQIPRPWLHQLIRRHTPTSNTYLVMSTHVRTYVILRCFESQASRYNRLLTCRKDMQAIASLFSKPCGRWIWSVSMCNRVYFHHLVVSRWRSQARDQIPVYRWLRSWIYYQCVSTFQLNKDYWKVHMHEASRLEDFQSAIWLTNSNIAVSSREKKEEQEFTESPSQEE